MNHDFEGIVEFEFGLTDMKSLICNILLFIGEKA